MRTQVAHPPFLPWTLLAPPMATWKPALPCRPKHRQIHRVVHCHSYPLRIILYNLPPLHWAPRLSPPRLHESPPLRPWCPSPPHPTVCLGEMRLRRPPRRNQRLHLHDRNQQHQLTSAPCYGNFWPFSHVAWPLQRSLLLWIPPQQSHLSLY